MKTDEMRELLEREHRARIRGLGAECTLYLRRNGDFPLNAPCDIALYGSGARKTLKGGTGSGDVNVHDYVTIEQGLENAGFRITTKYWLDVYDCIHDSAHNAFIREIKERARAKRTMAIIEGMGAVMSEPEYDIPLRGTGDTAVYVLSRVSGEGNDRNVIPGDILLSKTEIRDITQLSRKYNRFLLVLNVGGVVDLSPLEGIENIMYLGQLGSETGNVLADIILGKTYPSGKLTTTWSAWEDYPDIGEFGDINETRYREGIYVGYRYFDAAGKKALFPFGYGLGNTDFGIRLKDVNVSGTNVTVKAAVANTGSCPGREVVQVYVSAPEGRLDKPYQELAAFGKTGEVLPGDSEEINISFDLRDVASYDEGNSSWILEKGDYILRLGNNSIDTVPVAAIRLDSDAVTLRTRKSLGEADFTDWKPERDYPRESAPDNVIEISAADIITGTVPYGKEYSVPDMVRDLSDSELAYMSVGAFNAGLGALSVIGTSSMTVPGGAGETYGGLRGREVPVVVMADGPAGLRLSKDYTVDNKGVHPLGQNIPDGFIEFMSPPVKWFMERSSSKVKPGAEVHHQYCTAIPIGTCIAQSWDPALAEACGDLVGREMEEFGVNLWLAPALNIHRDIRCGRNFEYFSEDPLISGVFAAAITRGVQRHPGCGTVIKHYAANNQENNRYANNSMVSERAMREIYLKGFGIAVREGGPKALMTSYNLLNGTHTSERSDLLEDILRCEFGFEGVVMTDWVVAVGMQAKESVYSGPDSAAIIAAGNDIIMPGSNGDYKKILKALKNGSLSREQAEINVSRIIRLAQEIGR